MTKQEIQNTMKEVKEQLSKLNKKLEELESQAELNNAKNKVFKPKRAETYYYILSSGDIDCNLWDNVEDTEIDTCRYYIGNCFKTREEAEFEVERLKVIAELKRFAIDHNEPLDWTTRAQSKYYLSFDVDDRSICYGFALTIKRNDIYFSSKELAQQVVAEIGEDRLKKYYFEVEE